MELYLLPQSLPQLLSAVEGTADPGAATVSAVDQVAQLTRVVEKLTKQMEQLKHTVDSTTRDGGQEGRMRVPRTQRNFLWTCGRLGHRARDCPNPARRQGNWTPLTLWTSVKRQNSQGPTAHIHIASGRGLPTTGCPYSSEHS